MHAIERALFSDRLTRSIFRAVGHPSRPAAPRRTGSLARISISAHELNYCGVVPLVGGDQVWLAVIIKLVFISRGKSELTFRSGATARQLWFTRISLQTQHIQPKLPVNSDSAT